MKKYSAAAVLCAAILALSSCGSKNNNDQDTGTHTAVQITDAVTVGSSSSAETAAPESSPVGYDPYSGETNYIFSPEMLEKQDGTDYGTILEDVEYYSAAAGDTKQCNILLPAGYDESRKYPVMYVIHGFGGSHSDQIHEDSYLTLLYGNMLRDGLAQPQIIVNVDMYTDIAADKDSKINKELRFIYDKVVDDIALDLMPFIEANFPVLTGRENTAIAGLSQGGSESLCTGFKYLDKFGYIGSFAPDSGVIPTEYYKGTFWNVPYFDAFPMPDESNTPLYLYLAVGSEDPYNVEVTKYYARVLNGMGVRNHTDVVSGFEHDYKFWRVCFGNFMERTFRT